MWSPVHVLLIGETHNFQPSSEWLWFKVILFLIVLSVIAFLIKRFNRTGKQLLGNRKPEGFESLKLALLVTEIF